MDYNRSCYKSTTVFTVTRMLLFFVRVIGVCIELNKRNQSNVEIKFRSINEEETKWNFVGKFIPIFLYILFSLSISIQVIT